MGSVRALRFRFRLAKGRSEPHLHVGNLNSTLNHETLKDVSLEAERAYKPRLARIPALAHLDYASINATAYHTLQRA